REGELLEVGRDVGRAGEPAQVERAGGVGLGVLHRDAELGGDGLDDHGDAAVERAEEVLDGVGALVGAAEGGGLGDDEVEVAGVDGGGQRAGGRTRGADLGEAGRGVGGLHGGGGHEGLL